MKYLHDDAFAALTSKLMDCPIHDNSPSNTRVLHGRIEAYTTKRTVSDKRYAVDLLQRFVRVQEAQEQQQAAMKRKRSVSTSEAPEVPPSDRNRRRTLSLDETLPALVQELQLSRRLLTDLILTLNLAFPDFDFGGTELSEICAIPLKQAVAAINQRITPELYAQFWTALDNVVTLSQVSTVYSFIDTEDILKSKLLPEGEDEVIWSANYFFVNKNAKRIVLFTCIETMRDRGRNATYLDCSTGSNVEEDNESVSFDMDPSMRAGGIPIGSV